MISHLYSLEQIRGISENYSNISGMDSKTWCKPNLSYLSFDNSTLKWKKSPFLIFWNAFLQACTCHTGFLWLKLQIFEGNYCHLNVISQKRFSYQIFVKIQFLSTSTTLTKNMVNMTISDCLNCVLLYYYVVSKFRYQIVTKTATVVLFRSILDLLLPDFKNHEYFA